LRLFQRNRKRHWERVYQKQSPAQVGWYQAYPGISLKLIGNAGAGVDASIIDVGGGASTQFTERYDIWHDRAVFHFLTRAEDRQGYVDSLDQALKPNGNLMIAAFGPEAPPKCSGLPVVRYSPETLQIELGDGFAPVEALDEEHVTPSGAKQRFIYCRFTKKA